MAPAKFNDLPLKTHNKWPSETNALSQPMLFANLNKAIALSFDMNIYAVHQWPGKSVPVTF